MIDGIPNRPLYFYQKDMMGRYLQSIGSWDGQWMIARRGWQKFETLKIPLLIGHVFFELPSGKHTQNDQKPPFLWVNPLTKWQFSIAIYLAFFDFIGDYELTLNMKGNAFSTNLYFMRWENRACFSWLKCNLTSFSSRTQTFLGRWRNMAITRLTSLQ